MSRLPEKAPVHNVQSRAVVEPSLLPPQDQQSPDNSNQHHIQPALPGYSHVGTTGRTTVPQTPPKRVLPDGGVSVLSAGSPSSKHFANIGVRRTDCRSVLLDSPARHGHTTRMANIFHSVGFQSQTASSDGGGISLYPQLPNISRPCTPELTRDAFVQQSAGCQLVPVRTNTVGHSKYMKHSTHSPSVGSWSDDSDFLVDESVPEYEGTQLPTSPGRSCIRDWLSRLSNNDSPPAATPSVTSSDHDSFGTSKGPGSAPVYTRTGHGCVGREQLSSKSSRIPTSSLPLREPTNLHKNVSRCALDLYADVVSESVDENSTRDEDDSIITAKDRTLNELRQYTPRSTERVPFSTAENLSPLSPNVCIERGPSRFRSTHHPAGPPTKRKRTSYIRGGLSSDVCEEMLASDSNVSGGVRRRFWRPPHPPGKVQQAEGGDVSQESTEFDEIRTSSEIMRS